MDVILLNDFLISIVVATVLLDQSFRAHINGLELLGGPVYGILIILNVLKCL
jgi:hypothetical protein